MLYVIAVHQLQDLVAKQTLPTNDSYVFPRISVLKETRLYLVNWEGKRQMFRIHDRVRCSHSAVLEGLCTFGLLLGLVPMSRS
jgi:hypothetical protein